tara:strand:+ start:999 stop:2402 length:1404 start_codon:yes stop_codon:yes gene_type:complete
MFDPAAFIINTARGYQKNGLAKYCGEQPGPRGGMSPPQKRFHRSQNRKRAFIAANKVGKTYWGAAEAWFHLLSDHPYREVPDHGSTGWVLCSDLRTGWETISEVMHELEPPGVLDDSCKYVPGIGYLYRSQKIIRTINGSQMVGKGCEQSLLALESKRVQWAWVDEPPKESHWHGLRARLTMDMAPYWLTLTPVGRPVQWLQHMLEGCVEDNIDPEPGWHVEHIELSKENAPHRSEEDIEAQKLECSPWEYNQRILAQWEGLTKDRWVSGFSEGNLFDDEDVPKDIQSIGLGFDHGVRPGKSVCHLVAWDGFTLWVLDEHSDDELSTPASEARAITEMLRTWGLELSDVDEARGDSNSAGKMGMGFSLNDLYMREFARIAGASKAPFEIRVPYKRRGSIDARVRMMSSACVDGRFRVHKGCTRLIHTLRHWRGANDDLKDPFDSCGYISEIYLAPSGNKGPGLMLIG